MLDRQLKVRSLQRKRTNLKGMIESLKLSVANNV
jgi:hypothetical protein